MTRTAALLFVAAVYLIGAAFDGPIDDGAQVIADDKNEVITAAAAAWKETP